MPDASEWRQRFAADLTDEVTVAAGRADWGIATISRGGSPLRLCAWDLATGVLRQIADDKFGVGLGWIDPAGRYVYFMPDETGTEHGHLTRVPSAYPAANLDTNRADQWIEPTLSQIGTM